MSVQKHCNLSSSGFHADSDADPPSLPLLPASLGFPNSSAKQQCMILSRERDAP
eukprot:CAMPEP_0171705526 /NCGR_PEP_ID=MMETSP0991-20121206/13242_1 /TAXON_ID=483369 /ORGANISM="non described non described, Strain CCMP2098" /LENGTH=53 /DNA_ID=CAMNT_0012295073 /DNA_START=382 /DNA_END=543 /DNA_ORIENTATION=-